MNTNIPAIIFAGGKSSRMGRDKALLPFGNASSLAAFQYARLSLCFKEVYISAKSFKFDFSCRLIEDKKKESSPLIGLISIFETLPVDEVFILSVDAPFVDAQSIQSILDQTHSEHDAVIAQSPHGVQPLCGVYKRSILPLAHKQLAEGNHKLQSLLKQANTHFVLFASDTPFTNINHPHEYEDALHTLKSDLTQDNFPHQSSES